MKTWQKIRTDTNLRNRLLTREKVMDAIREFFKAQGFIEVFTPTLVPVPSIEPNLEVFETQLKTSRGEERRAFLTMSPEFSIKKLLSGGVGKVFEITRAYRNLEEVSPTHNPEFTMLEWYRTKADYIQIMDDLEKLLVQIVKAVRPDTKLTAFNYQGKSYDLSPPWPRWKVAEAFDRYAGIKPDDLLMEQTLLIAAKDKGYNIDKSTTWEQVFNQMLFNEIEPAMAATGKPVILYDYPASQASLSKLKEGDPRWAERFEVFLAGMELGNCFSELIDAVKQQERFEADHKQRLAEGKTEYPIDEELISALDSGMPQTTGIAVGVDRLIMLVTDVATIAETLFFPAGELFDL